MAPRIPEHVRNGVSDIEHAQPAAVSDPHDNEVCPSFSGFVDYCGTGLSRLKQSRVNLMAKFMSHSPNLAQDFLRSSGLLLKRCVKRQASLNFNHIHCVNGGVAVLHQVASHPNHLCIYGVSTDWYQYLSYVHTAKHGKGLVPISQQAVPAVLMVYDSVLP